jgi:AAA ATPase-like protein/transcriptional activator
VRWIPAGPSEVDVLRFRDAMAAGDLELAARLYSGDLLPACYDDWVMDERAKLRAEAYGVLVRLRDEAAGRDDHEATIRHAQAIIDLEPTDEAAVRIQMEAHLALGDRAAALRSYHRYAEVLERDLAVEPGEAIGAMYRHLRVGTSNREGRQGDDVAPVAEWPFVGRDLELNLLNQAWNAAREGRAHLVLVSGEAGIGKSRLALELGRRVRAEGYVVAAARAYEAAGRLPWGPVVDLLRSDALRSHIDTLGTVWRAELARLLPELLEASPPPEPSRSGDLAARHRLFDAVGRAIVGDRPRLLIIDDLQWCDAETIELIGFVIHSGQTAPVLIVGTVRSEEIPEQHPLAGGHLDVPAAGRGDQTIDLGNAHRSPLTVGASGEFGIEPTRRHHRYRSGKLPVLQGLNEALDLELDSPPFQDHSAHPVGRRGLSGGPVPGQGRAQERPQVRPFAFVSRRSSRSRLGVSALAADHPPAHRYPRPSQRGP